MNDVDGYEALTPFRKLPNGETAHTAAPFQPVRNVQYLNGSFAEDEELYRGMFGGKEPTRQHTPALRSALDRGLSLQFFGIHRWVSKVAEFALEITQASTRPTTANAFLSAPGLKTSLHPHTDEQCILVVQLHGRKRWKLWKRPYVWLPTRPHHTSDPDLRPSTLGTPFIDAVLEPGDVLYVPRGCLHGTSTELPEHGSDGAAAPGGSERASKQQPSLHLTIGLHTLMTTGTPLSWEAFFGADKHYRHDHVVEALFTAIGNLAEGDNEFRKSVPRGEPVDLHTRRVTVDFVGACKWPSARGDGTSVCLVACIAGLAQQRGRLGLSA